MDTKLGVHRQPISLNAAQALANFLAEDRWAFSSNSIGPRTVWLQVNIESLAVYGFFPGWLAPGKTVRILLSRFKRCFLKLC